MAVKKTAAQPTAKPNRLALMVGSVTVAMVTPMHSVPTAACSALVGILLLMPASRSMTTGVICTGTPISKTMQKVCSRTSLAVSSKQT